MTSTTMTFGSLFAGIGGFDLGLERAGMQCAWQVEIDPFCQKVLAKHWPDVPRFEDVRDVGRNELATVDLICGGFPCQDVSLAGERAGLEGERSTLWSEFARIIRELRPRWVVVENVRGLLSSDDGRFFGNILRDLAGLGYDAEWQGFPASALNAPHIRERVWVIAYPCGQFGLDGILQKGRGKVEGWRKEGVWGNDWREFDVESRPAAILRRWQRSSMGQSPLVRVDDGIPAIPHRLRALGNAVVPQVVEFIGRLIVEADAQ